MLSTETVTGDYLEAIHALRVFRAAEGIDVLTRQLRYEPTQIEMQRTYDAYVASGPLIAIGPPAISSMLKVIYDTQQTEIERRVACWVLLNIEASADSELEPDSDAVRDAVTQRLSRLKYLRPDQEIAVGKAMTFIEFFAITEGRWQELPVITNPPRPIRIGQSVRHQFQCQKPLEHPNAVIEFLPSVTELEDLGLKLSKSGELTGTPKGTCRFTIRAKATWKSDCGKSEESSEGANRFALGVFSDE